MNEAKTEAGLSVSMIVRDEARRLPRCIAALGTLADEICILDTGSADDTMAVARSLGCRVSHFPWCDDFSAARNAALSPCRHSWILSLDADEVIAPEDHGALRALLQEPARQAYRLATRNYTDETTVSGFEPLPPDAPHGAGFAGWFPSAKVRLFPNRNGIRFEGIIHELPNPSLARLGIPIADCAVPIHHYPLLNAPPGAAVAKRKRYLDLARKKVAANPGDARACGELGDLYADAGDFGAAAEAYKSAVALEPGEGRWLKNLGAVLFLLGHYPQAQQALRLAVTLDPSLEEGWRNLGVILLRQGQPQEARDALERAVDLNDRNPEILRYLAIAEMQAGQPARAQITLERLLDRFPAHKEGRSLYEKLLAAGSGTESPD